MPDNTTVNSIPVATRSVTYSGDASQNAQVVGLVAFSGSDDAKTASDLPGDGTNGLDVDVTRVIPGTTATALGKAEDAGHSDGDTGVLMLGVRGYSGAGTDADYSAMCVDSDGTLCVRPRSNLVRVTVQSGSLTTTATPYSAGDQMGSQFTIAGAARASGLGGYIRGVCLVSAAVTVGSVDVVFTDSSITLASDNAAYAISDADALKVVSLVQLAGAFDIGNNRIATAYNLSVPYICSGGTSLYAGLITRTAISGTPFANATDIQLIVYLELA